MALAPDSELHAAAEAVGRGDAATEATLRSLCARFPQDARVHFLLGALLERGGRYAESLATLDKALQLEPDHVQALSAKAVALGALGRIEDARLLLVGALERLPASAQLWANLGVVREAVLDFEGALLAYDRALALPESPLAARLNRGYVLTRLGRLDQALENNRALADLHPGYADAHFNLADVLLAMNRPSDALEACESALQIAPAHGKALIVFGLALSQLGRFEEARDAFASARARDPATFRCFVNVFNPVPSTDPDRFDPELIFLARAYERFHDCDWSDREAFIRQFRDIVQKRLVSGRGLAEPALAYNALTLPLPESLRLDIARALSIRLAAEAPPAERSPGRPTGTERLRIGYLSPDMREHVNAYLLRPLLALHDRTRFEIFCYSVGPADESPIGHRARAAADRFVDASGLAADEICARIRADDIHVLIDAGGFTTYSRPDVLVRRPAPVQVSYLAFPGSLGMDAVQYRITDRKATPPSQQDAWTEALVYLPDTFFIYDRSETFSDVAPSRAEYGLPEDAFVFCSFNNYYKIEPEIFGVWMEILKAVPAAVLWLNGRNAASAVNLRREAGLQGVSDKRLVFAPYEARERYRARYRLADLFLDTPVFNAMTTACDALAAGLPLLTVEGTSFPSRVAASLLNAARFPDGIVESLDAYRERAIHWGNNPGALLELKTRLLKDPLNTPLFDTEARVRQLEKAYEEMWRRYSQGLPPEPFDVVAQAAAWKNPWH